MNTVIAQHRCWNHTSREAVCRCLGCSRSFCRECVTEHDSRLLCAVCVNAAAARGKTGARGRGFVAPGAALAGLLLTWMMFYSMGRVIFQIHTRLLDQRLEQQWQRR